MRIESADFFYLSMPEVLDIGDGSQDALLVRLRSDTGLTGWGECEAAPLPSIAAWIAPMSHSACKPLSASVLGQEVNQPADIRRINAQVRADSYDLLQTAHTLSGIDMAMWDLLGKYLSEPAYRLLGFKHAYPKLPYASMLFGDTPDETLAKAKLVKEQGWRAAKFGWGPIGLGTPEEDAGHFEAARAGLGEDAVLCVDIGTIWGEDVERAAAALPALHYVKAHWLEEPFEIGALHAYAELSQRARPLPIAAGEGSHHPSMARQMIDYGGVSFIQIDAGRIGGLSPAAEVARYAARKNVAYVNHTFTSQLALAASLAPFIGMEQYEISEYPVEAKSVARAITVETIERDAAGRIHIPEKPGLGMTVNVEGIKPYLVDTELCVRGRTLYRTPRL